MHYVIGRQGPVLLLLHGWMGTWYSWRKVMLPLSERFTVIAPDAREYADSDKPYGGYDGLTVKEDFRQLLKSLGYHRAYVMEYDTGAPVALLYAAHHPEEVTGVSYFDEPLLDYNLDPYLAFSKDNPFVYWWFVFNATEHMPALLWEGKEAQMVDYLINMMVVDQRAITAADKAEYVRGLRSPGGWRAVSACTTTVSRRANRSSSLPGVADSRCPSWHLLVHTEFRALRSSLHPLQQPLKGVGVLENTGHLLAEEAPGKVVSHIVRFAERHPAS
jgi:pimeloyl-ACP methyl ester carboxylesterase